MPMRRSEWRPGVIPVATKRCEHATAGPPSSTQRTTTFRVDTTHVTVALADPVNAGGRDETRTNGAVTAAAEATLAQSKDKANTVQSRRRRTRSIRGNLSR